MPKDNKKDIFAILEEALQEFNIKPRMGSRGWIRIPAVWRGSRDYNISVSALTGRWIDFVEDGKLIHEFSDLMNLLNLNIDQESIQYKEVNPNAVQDEKKERQIQAKRIWDGAKLLNRKSDASVKIVSKYLSSRGLDDFLYMKASSVVRAFAMKDGAMMVSPIIDPVNLEIIGLQRVFLDVNGNKKFVDGDSLCKAMLGSHMVDDYAGGLLIQMDPFCRRKERTLIVCEGLETGMAIHVATGMPIYVMYNAAGVERVNTEYLRKLQVSEVIIAADNDTPNKMGVRRGQQAAYNLAKRLYDERIPVRIAIPYLFGTHDQKIDWLDVWNKISGKDTVDAMIRSAPFYDPDITPDYIKKQKAPQIRISKIFS